MQPVACAPGIGQGFLGAKGFRDGDEQRRGRVNALQRRVQICRVEIGGKAHIHVGKQGGAQCGTGQARTIVRASDADIDDMAYRRTGERTATGLIDQAAHALARGQRLGNRAAVAVLIMGLRA